MHEPFRQWVVEDRFVGSERPDLGAVGVQLVEDVTPFETMKLRCLNGTHSSLAYLGYLTGHETISDTVADPAFAAFVPAPVAGGDHPDGGDAAGGGPRRLCRGAVPALRATRRSGTGPGRSPWTARRSCRSASSGRSPTRGPRAGGRPGSALAVAAWMRYVGGVDEEGRGRSTCAIRWPRGSGGSRTERETPEAKVAALLGVREIFPAGLASDPEFKRKLTLAYSRLQERGASAAVAACS